MLADRYGNPVSTSSPAALDAYVEGCDLLFSGNAGPLQAFQRAVEADPGFAIAHAAKARVQQLRGDPAAARATMEAGAAAAPKLTAREASTMAYFGLVTSGQGDAAIDACRAHMAQWPRDAMVLMPCTSVFGLIGFSGRKGREQMQVELMDWLAPHYGDDWWFNSQHAFALDEVGQRSAARKRIERVMQQTPRNAHGAHIMAHVQYEDGEAEASRKFLRDWLPGYSRDGTLYCHISWHVAQTELILGDTDAAYAMFDAAVVPGTSASPPLNIMTDGVAFLWRAELAGGKRDPERWAKLHDYAHQMFPSAGIAFADAHILLADVVSGDNAGFQARMDALAEREREGKLASGPVVPALGRAFAAFAREDWNAAIAAIEPVFAEHERIGGSRAQRDIVEFTLLKAYVNAGRQADVRRYLDHRREGARAVPVAGVSALQ
jgi:hypothetical protein